MAFADEVGEAGRQLRIEALRATAPQLPASTEIDDLEAEVAAEVYRRMLSLADAHKDIYGATQGMAVLWVVEDDRWMKHPDHPQTLRDFLKLADLNPGQVTDLNALGAELVPYTQARGIYNDLEYTVVNKWPHFKEAIPALRQVVRDDNPDTFLDVLQDVLNAKVRNAVRKKYRQTRTDPVGAGTTVGLDDGRRMLIVVVDNELAMEKVIHRLNGIVTWDLLVDQQDCKIKAQMLR